MSISVGCRRFERPQWVGSGPLADQGIDWELLGRENCIWTIDRCAAMVDTGGQEAFVMRNRLSILFFLIQIAGFSGTAATQTIEQQRAWCSASDPDLAIGGCTAVIQSGREPREVLAGAFENRGIAYDDKGQYDRAIQDFDQAIQIDPNFASAFYNRGLAYYRKGLFDRAIQDYDQAIRLDANYATAFVNRGVVYARKGQHNRAIQDFDEAIRLNPNSGLAFYDRGMALRALGQQSAATRDFAKARQLNPNLPLK